MKHTPGNPTGDIMDDSVAQLATLREAYEQLRKRNAVLSGEVRALKKAHRVQRDILRENQVVILMHGLGECWPVSYVSDTIKDLLGYSRSDLLHGRVFYQDIIDIHDREQVVRQIQRHVDAGDERFQLAPYRVKARNTEVLWVKQSSRVYRDAAGQFLQMRTSLLDITQRKHVEEVLQERQAYLWTLRNTIQTGMLVVDCETGSIMDANPCAEKMVGCGPGELVGMYANHFIARYEGRDALKESDDSAIPEGDDCVLQSMTGKKLQVRRSCAKAVIGDREYSIQSFLDISDIRHMLDKQSIDIDLARNVLRLVNRMMPRYLYVRDEARVFLCAASMPCYAEGGDHFFVRTISAGPDLADRRTFITLKDQSGHQVSCVLRSTITDLMHHAVLTNFYQKGTGTVIHLLNNAICRSGLFHREDFVTAVAAELNHETLILDYLSAGHPPFLLIRNRRVMLFPVLGGRGAFIPLAVVPDIPFRTESIQLYEGDKVIFYTDGLTEMPLKKTGQVLSREDLIGMVEEILRPQGEMPVSMIMQQLLHRVAGYSGESVEPSGRNTSQDDVTILAMEVETPGGFEETVWKLADSDAFTDCVNALYKQMVAQWLAHGFREPEIRLRSVLEETLLNAWKHGNKCRPEKRITVRWKFTNDCHLEVLDEGEGFDPDIMIDPTLTENLLKPEGRGLFIIQYYADHVRWGDGGRRIRITFQRAVTAAEAQERRAMERLMTLWRTGD
ncbi:MAG: PAS domain S-box protein [Spartobacteria bacterium]|nr:PAS domain S-box protein [Spartobacteria bacterium]